MNPIRVHYKRNWRGEPAYAWKCRDCPSLVPAGFMAVMFSFGYRPTLAEAADAGREHCRDHHRQSDYVLAN